MRIRTYLFPLVLVMILLLPACTAGSGEPGEAERAVLGRLSGFYETDALVEYGDREMQIALAHRTPEATTVALLSPDTLAGMEFSFGQDSVALTYKDLSYIFDPGSMPSSAAAKLLTSTFTAAARAGDDVALAWAGEGVLEVSGTAEGGVYSMLIDVESGRPLKLSVPSQELTISFENFTFLA